MLKWQLLYWPSSKSLWKIKRRIPARVVLSVMFHPSQETSTKVITTTRFIFLHDTSTSQFYEFYEKSLKAMKNWLLSQMIVLEYGFPCVYNAYKKWLRENKMVQQTTCYSFQLPTKHFIFQFSCNEHCALFLVSILPSSFETWLWSALPRLSAPCCHCASML